MKKIYILFLVLMLASCQSGKEQTVIEEGESVAAADDDLLLCGAAWDGEIEKVKALLDSGADVNAWRSLGSGNHTPLMYAAYTGQHEVAKILIEAGADVNAAHSTDHTVLYHALESYQLSAKVIQLLVDAEVNLNYTPLLWAIKNRSSEVPEIVTMLIEAGADVNERDEYGTTALINAVKYRRIQLLDVLLRSGAEIDAVGKLRGRTALAWAVAINAQNTVKKLIEAGANLKVTDQLGNTPLMTAKSNGSEEIVKLLTDAGATQ